MWVCRYGAGSLYVHIEDGWRSVRCGKARARGAGRGLAGERRPHRVVMAATTPALSDDKNAIIMAPE